MTGMDFLEVAASFSRTNDYFKIIKNEQYEFGHLRL